MQWLRNDTGWHWNALVGSDVAQYWSQVFRCDQHVGTPDQNLGKRSRPHHLSPPLGLKSTQELGESGQPQPSLLLLKIRTRSLGHGQTDQHPRVTGHPSQVPKKTRAASTFPKATASRYSAGRCTCWDGELVDSPWFTYTNLWETDGKHDG